MSFPCLKVKPLSENLILRSTLRVPLVKTLSILSIFYLKLESTIALRKKEKSFSFKETIRNSSHGDIFANGSVHQSRNVNK